VEYVVEDEATAAMITLRNVIIYTTFPAIFSSACYLQFGGVDLQLFYFIMLFNLWLMVHLGTIWIPRGLVLLITVVALSGAIGILRGTDTVPLFAKNFFGISISALYFCSFLRLLSFDVEYCFRTYARLAYYVALIGVILLPFQAVFYGKDRLQSVLSEPAMFAITCLPALFYFADQWQTNRSGGRQLFVLALAFALAGSSVGFLGILLGLCIFGTRYRYGAALVPVLVGALGLGIYSISRDFRLRLDDTVKSSKTLDVEGVNLSTFSLVANLVVTQRALSEHPLMGAGIGSHVLSHQRFLEDVLGVDTWEGTNCIDLNASDASSLLLRVLSEMGTLGIVLVGWFIWHYRRPGNDHLSFINKSIWIYFFVKLLRAGHYFSPEQFLFIVVYAANNVPFNRIALPKRGTTGVA